MKLELYDDVSQKLVEYVRQIHPPEDSAPPSEKEITTTPNDIVQRYLGQEEIWGTRWMEFRQNLGNSWAMCVHPNILQKTTTSLYTISIGLVWIWITLHHTANPLLNGVHLSIHNEC
jgi:hypothetical protein